MQVLYRSVSLVTSSESKQKFVGKIFVRDTSLSENFSWMEANHENNEIKSTTKIFTYTVNNFWGPLKLNLPRAPNVLRPALIYFTGKLRKH